MANVPAEIAKWRGSIEDATRLKEKANEAFKEAEYAVAGKEYEQAMGQLWSSAQELSKTLSSGALSPEDAVNLSRVQVDLDALRLSLLLNLALVALKTEDMAAVIGHCSAVLAFQPTNVKALFRRGVAKARLGRAEEAKEDLEKTIMFDPTNVDAKKELALLRKRPTSVADTATTKIAEVSSYLSMCFGFCAGQGPDNKRKAAVIELSKRC
jgi:tetratricopeptide (TPR) repeat protein